MQDQTASDRDFRHLMVEDVRGRLSAIKAVAEAQKERYPRSGSVVRRMDQIAALADTTLDTFESFLSRPDRIATAGFAQIRSHDADRFLGAICSEVRPRVRLSHARVVYRRPPKHLQITAESWLLRRALVSLFNVALRHVPGGHIGVILYEACGNTVIEVSYGPRGSDIPEGSADLDPATEAVRALLKRDELDLNLATGVARAHGGELAVIKRRRPLGTILRLQIPTKAPHQHHPGAHDAAPLHDSCQTLQCMTADNASMTV